VRLLDRVAYTSDGALRPNALVRAAQVFRWGALAWLAVLVATGIPQFATPWLGWVVLALITGWTVALTMTRPRWSIPLLAVDLTIAVALLVVDVETGYFATIYPIAAPLTWAAVHGFRHGLFAGGAIAAVLIGTHLVLGLEPGAPTMYVVSDAFTIILAISGVGVVSSLLRRSTAALLAAQAEELAAREAAARLAERDSLGRKIHDSVLQSLTMVHKRGRELAAQEAVPGSDVARLAELAAAQQVALRDLLLRTTAPPVGAASVPATLAAAAATVRSELDVVVNATEDVTVPAATADSLAAAVEQALRNVVAHAGTDRAWVFAERDGTNLVVSVRDDGCGFVFDAAALRHAGRLGLLSSIQGRIEDVGGTLTVTSYPGKGTELEIVIPLPSGGGTP